MIILFHKDCKPTHMGACLRQLMLAKILGQPWVAVEKSSHLNAAMVNLMRYRPALAAPPMNSGSSTRFVHRLGFDYPRIDTILTDLGLSSRTHRLYGITDDGVKAWAQIEEHIKNG